MTEGKILINLRGLRKDAGLSLSKAAELTGVSKAMLGQIERGESSPTIATLWKLAKGFGLPLTAFLEGGTAPARVQFPGSIDVEQVFAYDPLLCCETFVVRLQPGQEHCSEAHDAGVTEDVYVTEGPLEVLTGGFWLWLETGASLRFAADQPHGYRVPETKQAAKDQAGQGAVFLNTLHYPPGGQIRT
jgi:transcriptional regulator with XRE-family HTH domain